MVLRVMDYSDMVNGRSALTMLLLWLGLLVSAPIGLRAQTPPQPLPYYAAVYPTTNRTNLCDRMTKLENGSINIADALRGATIKVAIVYDTTSFNMMISNETGKPFGGFMFNLQQQIAARGGFNIDYTVVPSFPTKPQEYRFYLKKILRYVDMLGNRGYADTVTQRADGIGFMRGIVDQSLVLITQSPVINNKVDFFSFLTPFSNTLWAWFAGVIFFNGFVHYFVDPFDIPNTTKKTPFYRMFYLSFGTFTNVESLASSTASGNILYTGYGFFILIMVASYTANLASSLVTNQQNSVTVTSITHANDLAAR